MNRILNTLLLGLLFCLLGCQNTSAHKVEKTSSEQILKINIQGDIVSLHPHIGVDLPCRIFQKALFEGLTRIDLDDIPRLAGAEKVEISPCQKIYTFTLKPMYWTNGEKVTAYHFEKSWKKALSPHSNCLRPDLFYSIKNAEKVCKGELPLEDVEIHALDEKTLVIKLEHPTPYFLNLIANPLFSPIYDEAFNPSVFNGPFKIISWSHDQQLIFEKNPDYWDAASVQLKRIEVSQVRDANTALLMYEKNELDWIGHPFTNLTQDALAKMENSPNYCSRTIAGVYWLSINTQSFPLNSVNIRKALSVAINRTNISKHVLLGETPTKSILPTGLSLIHAEELYSDSDGSLARSYFEKGLAELGISEEQFPNLILDHSDIPGQKKLAEAIQQTWQSVLRIKVDLCASEWNVFCSKLIQKQYQIGGSIWFSVYNDPIYTLDFFRNPNQYYNTTGWENSDFQKLLTLAEEETEPSSRAMYLKEAELIILDEMPIIPLFVFHSKNLKTSNLKNLIVNNLGHVDFKWAYFE